MSGKNQFSNHDMKYPSQRMPIYAKNCVATSQPLAAQVGLQILQNGGNAVDAAIATAITLTVVEPTMNSLGSDVFAMVWDGKHLHGLNASGKSPHVWNRTHFARYKTMPQSGWDTVTVPGAVSGWLALAKEFGRLPFAQLFEQAINYAKNGFLVSPIVAEQWQMYAKSFKNNPEFARAFLPKGRAPNAGELFCFPQYAKTLEQVAQSKGKAFYEGEIAEKIAHYAKQEGALLTLEDLKTHQPHKAIPLKLNYRGYELYELPPNGQGLTVLIALGILHYFDMHQYPVDSADSIHLQIEAMKLAFSDAKRYIADPDFMQIKVEDLLTPEYLSQRAKLIHKKRAQSPEYGIPHEQGTVYLTTSDSKGMMVSFIQSHYLGFGSGVVIPDSGILMQNRGACFTLEPGHPNEVAGNKLPFHTILPGFLFKDNKPLMSFGVMGGHMQAQGHVQVIVRLCDYQQNPQTVLDAPRWYISPDNKISLEASIHPKVIKELIDRGHELVPSPTSIYGGGQAIYCLEEGYMAVSDPRKDGQAVGF
ncbi:gamma-glutamyltranspeptidase [Legionella steigerwaltii]|uniref:Glutathione hydrolase proenzyme n=1 Tax=Legionella steigerwaltii TaxID=460 RepID=A0A378LC54_9GAMM|nr:gamma-glutamyltransferase [Legionella steigerwaltii]KTD78632.1 gamma-glutamyltranspeptidase [Legionella steigerwaltii]STY24277.1 gamma-glutamyltranspeptidase [Legionella steigerwaltii]